MRRMTLTSVTWLITAALCIVLAVVLAFTGYLGYFGVVLAVGLAAAVNLLPRP